MSRVLLSATKAALGWVCKHLMLFGVFNPSRLFCSSNLCFLLNQDGCSLHFLLLLVSNRLALTVAWPSTGPSSDPCSAALYLGPGPALKPQARWALKERGVKIKAMSLELSLTLANKERAVVLLCLSVKWILTCVGVGWGRTLQVRGGVRWGVKTAWSRRRWRQHAGVWGGRLRRNGLREEEERGKVLITITLTFTNDSRVQEVEVLRVLQHQRNPDSLKNYL